MVRQANWQEAEVLGQFTAHFLSGADSENNHLLGRNAQHRPFGHQIIFHLEGLLSYRFFVVVRVERCPDVHIDATSLSGTAEPA